MQSEMNNEFDELIENAINQSEQIDQSLGRYAIIDVDGFFNLNRTLLASSFMIIILASLGGGPANVSTMEFVLFCGGTLSVFLFTTFIEIRNFISWLSK
jgi:hypothetical protein